MPLSLWLPELSLEKLGYPEVPMLEFADWRFPGAGGEAHTLWPPIRCFSLANTVSGCVNLFTCF